MLNMKKNVKVREILGRECNIEDAILLREIIKNNLEDIRRKNIKY